MSDPPAADVPTAGEDPRTPTRMLRRKPRWQPWVTEDGSPIRAEKRQTASQDSLAQLPDLSPKNKVVVESDPSSPLHGVSRENNTGESTLTGSRPEDFKILTKVPLNAMDQAAAGKAALDSGSYDRAVELYSLAIKNKPDAVDYYIQRSVAYTRLKPSSDYQAALIDAETAVLLAYKREKKELILKSQLRRAIALANLDRLGDADFILQLIRNMHGPKAYREEKVDNAMLDVWEKRVQVKLAEVRPGDARMQVKVTEIPDEQVEQAMAMTSLENEEKEAAERAKAKEDKAKAGVTQAAQDIRHDYYQSGDTVTLTIYAKQVPKEAVLYEIKEDAIHVSFPTVNGERYKMDIDPLFAKIDLVKSKFSILRTGLVFQLRKTVLSQKWPSLYGDAIDNSSSVYSRSTSGVTMTAPSVAAEVRKPVKDLSSEAEPTPSTSKAPSYPTSSKSGPKNWDKIASESLTSKKVSKDNDAGSEDDGEDSDDGPGDGADKFFRKLYSGADPDTKRAMLKSFTESDGTALSTNWAEVKKGTVEPKPPRDD